jgi:hypothetical protein
VEIVARGGVAGGRDDGEQRGQGQRQTVQRHDVLGHSLVIEFAEK